MIKKLILVLTSFLLLGNSIFAVEKPQKYMPYPIIFVSGIRTTKTSPSASWPSTNIFKELKKYYLLNPDKSNETPKYLFEGLSDNGEKSHLEFFFYDSKEAPVDVNANMLKNEIEKILSNNGGYYDTNANIYVDPCPTPKVIIVAHSYGGIIARYMLANNIGNIRDKVAAVFFLGTPQLGSPMAVIGYFLPKEIPYLMEDIRNINDTLREEDFTDRLWDKINFKILRDYERQKVIGNLKFIKWAESEGGLYTSVRDYSDYQQILNAIQGDSSLMSLYNQIPFVAEKGTVWATLIPDAQANTYRKKFELYNPANPAKPFVRYIPRDGDLSYDLSKAVLSTLGTDIGIEKVHAIAGTRDDLIRDYLCGKANGYMAGHFDRLDYSCIKNDFWKDGDGVISLASQKAIPGAESLNTHIIDAAHISLLWGLSGTGETDLAETSNIILQALDDKPVIENLRVISDNSRWTDDNGKHYYIVIKVKEYLLADIEISGMGLYPYETRSNIQEFYDPQTNKYKPYVKFDKDFLKERDDKGAPVTDINGNVTYLHLEPGEFYIKADYPPSYIKIKNSAGKEVTCNIGIISPYGAVVYADAYLSDTTRENPTLTYALAREQVYNDFLSKGKPVLYGENNIWGVIFGAYLYSSANGRLGSYYDPEKGAEVYYSIFRLQINMLYSCYNNFQLNIENIDNKEIKSITMFGKFMGGDNPNPPSMIIGPAFNMSVYHDTSNTWPPTSDSAGNDLIFSFNTVSYNYNDNFAVQLDPKKLNLQNGNNVLQSRPDFSEYNCLPESIPITVGGYSTEYERFSLFNPKLIVTYVDKMVIN